MEQQIQIRSNHNLSTPLNQKELDIAKVIWHVNQLQSYPLSDHQIEAWSKSINELRPNQDIEILIAIINMMKIGSCDYNPRLGIQNIFIALKKYDPICIGYRLKKIPENHFIINETNELLKINYYEGQALPEDLIWLVDKDFYLKNNLREVNPKIPQSINSSW